MKDKRPKAAIALFVLFCVFLQSVGCAAVRGIELSRRLIVEAIGIDLAEGGVTVTLQALDTHAAGGGEDPNSAGEVTKRCRFSGETVGQALAQIESSAGLYPLYSQARVLFLGRRLAENGVSEALDFFLREYNARSDILLAVAEDTAEALLFAELGEAAPDAQIWEDALLCGGENGDTAAVKLYRFMNLLYTETDTAFCPVMGLEDAPEGETKTPAIRGTAFFTAQKMRFMIDPALTRGALFLTDSFRRGALSVTGQTGKYTLRVIASDTKIKTRRTDDAGFGFHITVALRCDITEYAGGGSGLLTAADLRDAQEAGETELTKLLAETFREVFFARRADLCRFARRVGLKYPKAAERYTETMFSDDVSRVDIAVSLTIRRIGKENISI